MAIIQKILDSMSAENSEFKKHLIKKSTERPKKIKWKKSGEPERPPFYVDPDAGYEALRDRLEDIELAEIVEARKDQNEIEVG